MMKQEMKQCLCLIYKYLDYEFSFFYFKSFFNAACQPQSYLKLFYFVLDPIKRGPQCQKYSSQGNSVFRFMKPAQLSNLIRELLHIWSSMFYSTDTKYFHIFAIGIQGLFCNERPHNEQQKGFFDTYLRVSLTTSPPHKAVIVSLPLGRTLCC